LRIWTNKPYFKDNPEETDKILSKHKTNESQYDRKSAGNALRKKKKKYPELIRKEIKEWKLETKEIKQVYKLASKFIDAG
jgi:3-methyladenine DNA glycosylase AlkC